MNAVSKRFDCKQQFLLGILQHMYLQVIVIFEKRGRGCCLERRHLLIWYTALPGTSETGFTYLSLEV